MKFNSSVIGTINLHKSAWICGANKSNLPVPAVNLFYLLNY